MDDIERIIQSYFGALFQTSNPSSTIIDEVLEVVSPVVTHEMNHLLTTPYTMVEVTMLSLKCLPSSLRDLMGSRRSSFINIGIF